MGPARQALRESTKDIHDRLDRAAILQPLLRPDITAAQYRAALGALYGFHAPVERALGDGDGNGGDGAARLERLRDDLAVLGADPDALPLMTGLPPLDGAPARLAARYVLDGSVHGGRAMLPGITRALGYDAGRGARFLASDGLDMAGAWKALLVRLEEELADPAALRVACGTAAALFAALERWTAAAAHGLSPDASPGLSPKPARG
ncbi:biliverdin-producing heme oxygenase [Azospirillum agricola]|uniref:biliverdin-producing heme oxygenase n=1 Tax=Azospirillum agricola TaxID=1720247 RepID=UPI000A0F351C|nr:biliverdin-producing heme oxygenase [Azospirillum agricola]SMH56984.1 Heme oxygenase [Azospirillum lipoferum]